MRLRVRVRWWPVVVLALIGAILLADRQGLFATYPFAKKLHAKRLDGAMPEMFETLMITIDQPLAQYSFDQAMPEVRQVVKDDLIAKGWTIAYETPEVCVFVVSRDGKLLKAVLMPMYVEPNRELHPVFTGPEMQTWVEGMVHKLLGCGLPSFAKV